MPTVDYNSHDPDFSPEQEEQCARIIGGLRKINSKIVRLGGSLDALTTAADEIEKLLHSLDEVTQKRDIHSFRFEFDPSHPNNMMPFNPASGEFNPIAPNLKLSLEGNKLVAHCEYSNCYESAPDSVQGGMVAAVYDQLLAIAMMSEGATGPTIWLKINYLKPTPINQKLRFECEVTEIDGKKFMVKGSCFHGEQKISEAEGLQLKVMDVPAVDSAG